MISEPGRYKLTASEYHSDPCPQPSLSSTIAKIILKESPRHAWSNHPRLNPKVTPRQATFMDIGTVAHALLLQDGKDIEVIQADDYRSKPAQEARNRCYAEGRTPILAKHHVNANLMFSEAINYLRQAFGVKAVSHMLDHPDQDTEQSLIWQEHWSKGEVTWCRAMVDWIMPNGTIVDYKTTATSVRPDNIERHLFGMDYHVQQAFYERGMDRLFPDGQGRRFFYFLFQENTPPFACQLIKIDEGAMHIARRMVQEAMNTWHDCLADDMWPAYPPSIATVMMPGWQEQKWMQREEQSAGGIALPDYLAAG